MFSSGKTTELKFLITKLLHQKQSPGSALLKKCSQKFRKTDSRNPVSNSNTGPFLSMLKNFQQHFFYWTPPVVVFSNFKAPGFTEAVMEMNFWITHDLVHLRILSSSWHFCVYLWQAQAFRCISTAYYTFLTKKDRNKLILESANFLLRKLLS